MPQLFGYHLFISHAWRYSDDYGNLKNLLDNAKNFSYVDYSISKEKSIVPPGMTIPDKKIKATLKEQISHATAVLSVLGMYGSYHEWMQIEAALALSMNKSLIGIKPRGQIYTPNIITATCTTIVGWNTDSIINAIRSAH